MIIAMFAATFAGAGVSQALAMRGIASNIATISGVAATIALFFALNQLLFS